VTSLYADLQSGVREVDAWQRCYPTSAVDVAGVLAAMVGLHDGGERISGVLHWQGDEQFTWHEMMLLVAEITGLDASGVTAVRSTPSVPLPKDTRLDCSRLEGLIDGSRYRTPFREGLRQCLAPVCGSVGANSKVGALRSARLEHRKPEGSAASDPDNQFRDELKKRGAALQELFWQELERTRSRLKEAGFAEGKRAPSDWQPADGRPPGGPAIDAESMQRGAPAGPTQPEHGLPGTLRFLPEQRV